MRYSAFISYSQEIDSHLAGAIRSALQRFAKPWYRLRATRIFQDRSSQALAPSLWGSITRALDDSAFLILLASPEAATSKWVQKEIEHWLQTHPIDTVLPVLTAGDVVWDTETQQLDADRTTAIPPLLRDAYTSEPLYLDLRWIETTEQASLRHPRFRDAIATLAATLRGQPKDELIGEDVRTHRNARRLAWSGGALVCLLACLASVAAIVANQQRREAVRQRDTANARLLGVQAEQLLDQNPELLPRSALLAIEAVRRGAGPQAEMVLRTSLALLPRLVTEIDVQPELGRVAALAFTPGGESVVIGGDRGLGFWDAATGAALQRIEGRVEALAVDPAGNIRALHDGQLARLSLADLGARSVISESPPWRGMLGGGTPGWYAWPERDGTVRLASLAKDRVTKLPLEQAASPGGRARALAFAADGSVLAAVTGAGAIKIWSLPSATHSRTIAAKSDRPFAVPSLALSPTGDQIAASFGDTIVKVWTIDDDAPPIRFDHGDDVFQVLFFPNGQGLTTIGDGTIRLWDLAGREQHRVTYEGRLDAVAFSPDGDLLAVAQRDAPVRLWALAGERAGTVAIPVHTANAVALSPDAAYLATGEDHGLARVFDLATGGIVHRLDHPPASSRSAVDRIAFTAQDSQLAVTSLSGDTVVWSLGDGSEVTRLSTPDLVGSTRLSPDGTLLAGLDGIEQTEVWDIRSGKRVVEIDHDGSSWRPLVSPDQRLIAVKRKSELLIYAIASGKRVAYAEIDPSLEITDAVFSPDSHRVAFGGEDRAVTVWDLQRDAAIISLPQPAKVTHVHFTTDGRFLVVATDDGIVRVIATDTWREVAQLTHGAKVVWIGGGTSRVATSDAERRIRVWAIPSGRLIREVGYDDEVQVVTLRPGSDTLAIAGRRTLAAVSIDTGDVTLRRAFVGRVSAFALSSTGRYLAVGLTDGETAVWDTATGDRVLDVPGSGAPADIEGVAFSPDGRRLATVAEEVHVWDLASEAEIARVPAGGLSGGAVAFSPDGAYVAVGGSGAEVSVWELASRSQVCSARHANMISSVALSPDGHFVAACGPPSREARVWRVATGELLRAIPVETSGGLLRVAFHPNGRWLTTAGLDGSIRFWNLDDGTEAGRLLQGTTVSGLDITADGRFLATTSGDHIVRVWSLNDSALVSLIPHDTKTRSLALSRDARWLATVDNRQQLAVWDLDGQRLLTDACRRLSRNLDWVEWQQYFGGLPYRKTCEHIPVHDSTVQAALELAHNGHPEGARAQLTYLRDLDPTRNLDVDDALASVADALEREAVSLAERDEIARAAQVFATAARVAGQSPYDFAQRARAVAVTHAVETGIDEVLDGKAAEAVAEFTRAAQIDPAIEISATAWNDLCWFGVVYGHATEVLDACDRAVGAADQDLQGFFADARGVARLATGDLRGAIDDFETFLRWATDKEEMSGLAEQRRRWIAALRSSSNPLDGLDLLAHSNDVSYYRSQLGLRFLYVSLD